MITFETFVEIGFWIYLLSVIGNWVLFYLLLKYQYYVTRGDACRMVILSLSPIVGTLNFLVQLDELIKGSEFFNTPIRRPKKQSERKLKWYD